MALWAVLLGRGLDVYIFSFPSVEEEITTLTGIKRNRLELGRSEAMEEGIPRELQKLVYFGVQSLQYGV